jgi:hypothetical protein
VDGVRADVDEAVDERADLRLELDLRVHPHHVAGVLKGLDQVHADHVVLAGADRDEFDLVGLDALRRLRRRVGVGDLGRLAGTVDRLVLDGGADGLAGAGGVERRGEVPGEAGDGGIRLRQLGECVTRQIVATWETAATAACRPG